MAVSRDKLAEALAYEQAKRQRLAEYIPTVAGPQSAPSQNLRTDLENLSAGLGQGIVNQLEGVKGLITDPIGTAKSAYEAVRGIVRDPKVLAQALAETGRKAMSGPLGAGEVIGEMIGPMRGKPVMAELDVYHGTPHRFPSTEANPLGEFDASKIGTGEGAQAYGHGIYFAENPGVARSYIKTPDDWAAQANVKNSTYRKAQAEIIRADRELRKQFPSAIPKNEISAFMYVENNKEMFPKETVEKIKNIRNAEEKAYKEFTSGSFYKADLPDEMIDRMLDWDKPLSEQSQAIQDLARKIGAGKAVGPTKAKMKAFIEGKENVERGIVAKGEDLYRALSDYGGQSVEGSRALQSVGIPGIRYLDAGSRGQGGSGTRNFVVFPGEEKKVKILERNGEKLAAALQSRPDEVMAQQYRISHRPMTEAGGASRLHEAYKSFGEEIYGKNALQFFGGGDPREAKIPKLLAKLRDNPDAELTIYRGVPKDAGDGINVGDWVTLDRNVAVDYGDKVIAKKVKAKDVTTWSDSLLEFGYYPSK